MNSLNKNLLSMMMNMIIFYICLFASILGISTSFPTVIPEEINTDQVAMQTQKALSEGLNKAALFESQKCVDARETAAVSTYHIEKERTKIYNEAWYIPRPPVAAPFKRTPSGHPMENVIYMRNYKVASTMMFSSDKHNYAGVKAGHRGETGKYRWNKVNNFGGHNGKLVCSENDVYFTIVREPISTFMAGWLEAECKMHKDTRHKDGTALFHTFLDKLEQGSSELYRNNHDAYHTWPQALKMDSVPQGCSFSYIGEIANLNTSLRAMFPLGSIPPSLNKASENLCKQGILSSLVRTAEDMRRICKLVYADFVCFGYELPEECQDIDLAATPQINFNHQSMNSSSV